MNELPTWTTAHPEWEKRIVEGGSLVPFAPLFPDEAAAGLEVMRMLRIVDAPGSPTIGESCAPWVLDFAAAVEGLDEVVSVVVVAGKGDPAVQASSSTMRE